MFEMIHVGQTCVCPEACGALGLCEKRCVMLTLCQQPRRAGHGSEFTLWYFTMALFPSVFKPELWLHDHVLPPVVVCFIFCLSVYSKSQLRTAVGGRSVFEEDGTRERRNARKSEWRESLLPENRWPPNSQWPLWDVEGQLLAPPGYQLCREGWSA